MLKMILLIAETIMYFPGGHGMPGTVYSTRGSVPAITVTKLQGMTVLSSSNGSQHSNSLQCFGYMTTPEHNPDRMPTFKASKKCKLCRGSGDLGNKSKCKCLRDQEKDWKEWRAYCKKNNLTGVAYVAKEWKKGIKKAK